MSWIQTIEPDAAVGDLADLYRRLVLLLGVGLEPDFAKTCAPETPAPQGSP